jgi:hypothetical protein
MRDALLVAAGQLSAAPVYPENKQLPEVNFEGYRRNAYACLGKLFYHDMLNNNILFPIRFMSSANFFIYQVGVHDVGKETLLSNIGRYHFNSNFRPLVHVFRCCICTHSEIPISRLSAYLLIALPKSMVMMWCQNI